ncbi:hypothetical protein FH972_022964 [Carpinus fangiana]|uniref:BTB domain-containing protein n=1 Tax=Carpinus fangiana TaxID=176857 RepID=A0A5N6KTT4_9ROSI|nr:hypothetical protein FH972_022964 [Carpinus fangiana]
MSAYLWKYYLEDDVDSFQQLLAEAGVQGRSNAPKGNTLGQVTALSLAMGSPQPSAFSPSSQSRSRSDAFVTSTPQPSSHREMTLGKTDINRRDGRGMTILHYAASSEATTALSFALALLAHPHIDLFIQDYENGWTALHRAFYAGNIAIARAIIERESLVSPGQAGPVANTPNLIKVKDKEGNGPYDLYAATIHDRTLHHGDHSADGLDRSRNGIDNESDDVNQPSDDESDFHLQGHSKAHDDVQGDELFTFGSNRNNTLGFGDEDDRLRPERVKLRRPDHLFKSFHREHLERKADEISRLNPSYSDKLRAQARLPKSLQDLPSVIRSRPMTIQDVQMAKFHTTVLTNDPVSNLYVCGHGLGGRLGTGSEKTQFNLVCLEEFGSQRKRIAAVAPGQDHTLAVTEQGELFTWGSNAYGQLGCGLPKAKSKPEDNVQLLPKQLFGTLKREIIVGVAASAIHSVVHTSTALFTFGKNAGQLGLVDSGARSLEAQGTPRNVTPSRFSSGIRSVSATDKATVCLLDSHEVFVFANFGCTRLDFPLDRFSNYFLKTSFLTTKYDDGPRRICKITSGGDTVCALSTAGEVYSVTVRQAIDPSSSITSSTTNPNKIKAGISAPSCVWSLKKDAMAARDVGVDQDGSVIINTEAGSVWRRVRRTKATSSTTPSQTQKAKDFKFSRVPNMTRAIAVRASGSGAYCAIRQECNVTKSQIVTGRMTLWDNLFAMLSFNAKLGSQSASGYSTLPVNSLRSSGLQSLIADLKYSKDLENDFAEHFSRNEITHLVSHDLFISCSTSSVKIPVHKFLVSARSSTVRQVRNELMKTAARLDLRNLEAAARRMLPTGDLSLNTDMELAIFDSAYFQTSDALVLLADGELLVHSHLLAQRCPFFEGLFRGRAEGQWLAARRDTLVDVDEAVEVDLKHIEMSVFKLVIRYLYADSGPELFDDIVTQDLEEFLDIVMEVLSVANELMLDRLSLVCQQVIGRHEFKDVGLEYLCLNLETVMSNHWLDELDEDLLLELDLRVRENQLDLLPIARSGRAEADLFERHPELVATMDRSRQAKLDALDLQSKYVNQIIPLGASFDTYDEDWSSSLPSRPKRSRHSRGSSASTTPKLNAKSKAFQSDIDDEFAAGLPTAMLSSSEQYSLGLPLGSSLTPEKGHIFNTQEPVPGTRTDRASLSPFGTPAATRTLQTLRTPNDGNAENAGKPWGSSSLPTEKLGIKEIMNQASTTSTSNLALGLRRTSENTPLSPSTPARLSQKERKKQQRQQSEVITAVTKETSSSMSPWQTVPSYSKPAQPSLTMGSASGPKPGEQARSASTPQLTMRQTVANTSSAKQVQKSPVQAPQTPTARRNISSPQVQKTSPGSQSGTPTSTSQSIAIQSIRHVPKPRADASPSSYMHQSLADIILQEQAGKDAIKEAVAKRSLQEIQQEQEFLEWWDHQSRATQEAEAAAHASSSVPGSKARGGGQQRGRGGRRRRGGGSGQSASQNRNTPTTES